MATVLADHGLKIVPEILTVGGGATIDGVGATLMKHLTEKMANAAEKPCTTVEKSAAPAEKPVPVVPPVEGKAEEA